MRRAVFERFSALRGGVIELGAGWVPEMLRTLDRAQTIFRRTDPQVAALSLRSSETSGAWSASHRSRVRTSAG